MHVVVVGRFPYDWVELMRLQPQHMPEHNHIDSVHDFVEKPWTMERPDRDADLADKSGRVCQQDFRFKEVVSCLKSPGGKGTPTCELKRDGSGDPFDSILSMRSSKLINHISHVKKWVSTLHVVKYEELIDAVQVDEHAMGGIFHILQKVSNLADVPWSCKVNRAPTDSPKMIKSKKFVS